MGQAALKTIKEFNLIMRIFCRRFQSTSLSHTPRGAVSLDLDFVLNLLDHSKVTNANSTTNTSASAVSPKWSQMKFKLIETEEETLKAAEKEPQSEMMSNLSQAFKNVFDITSNSSTDTLTRLQNLADSLPNQIYDRHGNLIPLNTSQPPSSFFDLENNTKATMQQQSKIVPIFHRENVDWSQVSITSILKKIVPEEAFLKTEESMMPINTLEIKDSVSIESSATNTSVVNNDSSCINVNFTQTELRLLDKDQLHSLAKHFRVSCDQTDLKIETELLTSHFNIQVKRQIKKKGEKGVSQEKICWTEENENLLVKLYDNLRVEKQKTDQKLITLLSTGTRNISPSSSVQSLKRGNGASERGIWAVLADQMRQASKSHASVSECRNKLIILKRLKP